jgi:short-subunit dehydrogenase
MSDINTQRTALVTGASSGIGAAYADRLARRGYDLIITGRDERRLAKVADDIRRDATREVTVLVADLAAPAGLAVVEQRLNTDARISLLVNCAGGAIFSPVIGADAGEVAQLISLNVTSLTQLSIVAATVFAARGEGTIVNVSASPALMLNNAIPNNTFYGATKSYVLNFTQAMQQEVESRGVRVQVVLPGAVAGTSFWSESGTDLSAIPQSAVMPLGEVVDAAMAGLDSGEIVTIPSLPDSSDWDAYENARQALLPNISRATAADRYKGK